MKGNIIMKFIVGTGYYGVPDIMIRTNKNAIRIINTVQDFKETEDKVILKCAEYVPEFIRGFVCDMNCEFLLKDELGNTTDDKANFNIVDLVLVYINKVCNMECIPSFEYVFFK
jgi:hypothetical protein